MSFPVARAILISIVCVILVLCIWFSTSLIGRDLGVSPLLVCASVIVILLSMVIDRIAHRHLKISMLLGYNELKADAPQHLLTEGIYARTRNPRYLSVMLAILGWSMLVNYSGVYGLCGFTIVALWLIALIEEKDLVERFGDEYREYRKRVPFLIPSFRNGKPDPSTHDSP